MGFDINCYCEVLKDNGWNKVGAIFKNESSSELTDQPIQGRIWGLFWILGFQTPHDIIPISKDRGYPKTLSKELKDLFKIVDDYGGGMHKSWCMVQELKEYPWTLFDGKNPIENMDILESLGLPNTVRLVYSFCP